MTYVAVVVSLLIGASASSGVTIPLVHVFSIDSLEIYKLGTFFYKLRSCSRVSGVSASINW